MQIFCVQYCLDVFSTLPHRRGEPLRVLPIFAEHAPFWRE